MSEYKVYEVDGERKAFKVGDRVKVSYESDQAHDADPHAITTFGREVVGEAVAFGLEVMEVTAPNEKGERIYQTVHPEYVTLTDEPLTEGPIEECYTVEGGEAQECLPVGAKLKHATGGVGSYIKRQNNRFSGDWHGAISWSRLAGTYLLVNPEILDEPEVDPEDAAFIEDAESRRFEVGDRVVVQSAVVHNLIRSLKNEWDYYSPGDTGVVASPADSDGDVKVRFDGDDGEWYVWQGGLLPAPVNPKVGDVVTTVEELDALPEYSVIRSYWFIAYTKGAYEAGWFCTGEVDAWSSAEVIARAEQAEVLAVGFDEKRYRNH